jgi:glutamate racemase
MDDRPIGMFDSGFGGLTVARAVIDLLPDEQLVYVGDTGRYPYGPRPLAEVRGFAHQITDYLVDQHDVKLVVVACNTASAAALDELQASCDVPVVGVIEPGARSLVAATRSGRVGVIGTVGTMSSGAYQRAVAAVDGGVELTCAACPGFVEFVEKGETASDQVHVLAERLLAPLVEAKVDTLLLGCTHYPFLARTIGDIMGRDVVLVSSADETAFEVRKLLLGEPASKGLDQPAPASRPIERASGASSRNTSPSPVPASVRGSLDRASGGTRGGVQHRWLSSGDVAWFDELGRRLLGPELDRAEPVTWPAAHHDDMAGGGDELGEDRKAYEPDAVASPPDGGDDGAVAGS